MNVCLHTHARPIAIHTAVLQTVKSIRLHCHKRKTVLSHIGDGLRGIIDIDFANNHRWRYRWCGWGVGFVGGVATGGMVGRVIGVTGGTG